MYYLNLFFIYSILGHCLEKIAFPNHTSGILYGFWTPVYGIGALIIILSFKFLKNKLHLNKITKFIIIFLIGSIALSGIEIIGGTLIEKIFHITFWDYSDMKYHIGKYASIEMGLLWGILSLVLIYIVQPFIKKLTVKIPKWVTYILIGLFILDIGATVILRAK